jgi:hypothetical protein
VTKKETTCGRGPTARGDQSLLGFLAMQAIYRPQQKFDENLDIHDTFFKLLNGVFCAKDFYMEVALKYQINIFFKFVIIKTQLIIR